MRKHVARGPLPNTNTFQNAAGLAPTSANATQKGRKSRKPKSYTANAETPQYSVALGRKRRRVVRPQRVDQILDAEEEYMLNLALANSRVDVGVERIDVPDAPVYRCVCVRNSRQSIN